MNEFLMYCIVRYCLFFIFPLFPIYRLYVVCYLASQWFQIFCYYLPHLFVANLVIIVHQYMTHTHYIFPRCVWMLLAKSLRQLESRFTHNLYIFHNCIEQQLVRVQFLYTFTLCKLKHIIYSTQNVLKSVTVSNGFSHISVSCHG